MVILLTAAVLGASCGGALTAAVPRQSEAPSPPGRTPETLSLQAPTVPAQTAPARPQPVLDLRALYRQASPAVVSIDVLVRPRALVSSDELQPGAGSGFVVDPRGLIVTNNHVVARAQEIEVAFGSGEVYQAEIVGRDDDSDLAVLRIEADRELPTLSLDQDDDLTVGEPVAAIGNPFGLGGTLTHGVVSAVGRTIPAAQTPFAIPLAVQTDAPINPGNSGGPLLNLEGEVVGVNTALESPTGTFVGVGFAVPVQLVRKVVPLLVEEGEVVWPFLGIGGGTVTTRMAEASGLSEPRGAYVDRIERETPAAQAGLRGTQRVVRVRGSEVPLGGDIILKADEQPIATFEDLLVYLMLHKEPGQRLRLEVFRDGQRTQLEVTLGTRP